MGHAIRCAASLTVDGPQGLTCNGDLQHQTAFATRPAAPGRQRRVQMRLLCLLQEAPHTDLWIKLALYAFQSRDCTRWGRRYLDFLTFAEACAVIETPILVLHDLG